jgi:hypothetical protein
VFKPVERRKFQVADRKATELKKKAKARYDASARPLEALAEGDIVRVQHAITKKWSLIAEVVEVRPRGRSYLIRSESGRLYWRNRKFLRRYHPPSTKNPEEQRQPEPPEVRRSTRPRKKPERYGH